MSTKYYDPTAGTWTVKFRWWLAWRLNKFPGTCWTNLVSWALGERKLYDPGNEDDARQNFLCRQDNGSGRCYCGKIKLED